eukprot:364639-Chlamydomonas_euryale.AAC.15
MHEEQPLATMACMAASWREWKAFLKFRTSALSKLIFRIKMAVSISTITTSSIMCAVTPWPPQQLCMLRQQILWLFATCLKQVSFGLEAKLCCRVHSGNMKFPGSQEDPKKSMLNNLRGPLWDVVPTLSWAKKRNQRCEIP